MKVYKNEVVKFKKGKNLERGYGYGIVHFTGDFWIVDVTPCKDDDGKNISDNFYPAYTANFTHTGNRIGS